MTTRCDRTRCVGAVECAPFVVVLLLCVLPTSDGVECCISLSTGASTSCAIAQIMMRAHQMDAWLSHLVPHAALPLKVAKRLATFLNLDSLSFYESWKVNQQARVAMTMPAESAAKKVL